MSAFRTTEGGVCAAKCGEPIELGDLVVMVNDETVHLDCEDPEAAIAAEQREPLAVDLVAWPAVDVEIRRELAAAIAAATDSVLGVPEVHGVQQIDLDIAEIVLRSRAVGLVRAAAFREAATLVDARGLVETARALERRAAEHAR